MSRPITAHKRCSPGEKKKQTEIRRPRTISLARLNPVDTWKTSGTATHAVSEADHPPSLINVDVDVSINDFEPVDELSDVDVSDKGARVGVGL